MAGFFVEKFMKFLIALATVWLAAVPAVAQISGPCMKRSVFLKELETNYGETPVALGIAAGGKVMEIVASRHTGTWTIIMTLPNGVACGIAAGVDWQEVPARPSPDSPA